MRATRHVLFCCFGIALFQAGLAAANETHTDATDLSVDEIPMDEIPMVDDCLHAAMPQQCRTWTIDYRVSTMFSSRTCYEFGTYPAAGAPVYAPLSRLNWSLDSVWHGLQIGVEKPRWRVHFEWLTPMTRDISGDMSDWDWSGPARDPASLSVSPSRWTDGQRLEFEGAFKLRDRLFQMPIELWPVAGFRFQRFNMMSYDGVQLINDGTFPDIPPVGYRWYEDTISSNQQYYMGYVGGQLRTTLNIAQLRPVQLTFQGDWAGTAGYNVDHHISGYEEKGIHRYGYDKTHGGALHLALIAETQLNRRLSVGVQVDHTEIRTTGTHHFVETGAETADEIWSNGVKVNSDQTSLLAFIRANF
jgi:hypothetical protein